MELGDTEDAAGGIEETDRVKLVELIKAADADAAYVRAVLRRLAALPVPSKAVMQLVAKDIARLKKKHADGAVRDLAGALMRKWIGHYGGTEPKPPTPRAAPPPAAPASPREAPRPRERSDDERKALQALRSTGITTVMNVSRPGEASAAPPPVAELLGAAGADALHDFVARLGKVKIEAAGHAAQCLRERGLPGPVRGACWIAACHELGRRSRSTGLDAPTACGRLLDVLEACSYDDWQPARHAGSEGDLELFAGTSSKEALRKRAAALLTRYRNGFCDLVGRRCVVANDTLHDAGSECVVTKRRDDGAFDVKFDSAEGNWTAAFRRDELRVIPEAPAGAAGEEREFDFLAPAAASPKKRARDGAAAASAAKRAASSAAAPAARASAIALRLANRTTMADEAPLMEALDWGVEDADESGEPANPRHRLPDVEDGFKRVYCERALIKPSGVDAFVLDRNGGDDARGCLMPKIRILAEDEDEAFDEYICAVHDMYYDVPTDPAKAEDYDADLKIAFSYMYTHAMLAEEFASLGSAGLEKCAPPFDEARELAECNDVSYMTSSVDFVRGVVHVAWTPEECVHFFRTREVGDGKLSAPKSTPAIELAKRAKALFS